MQIFTGIDIIEVSRIKDAIERQGEKFLHKIFTENEIAYCTNTGKMEYQHYAARFAAKEAVYKAISTKLPEGTGDIWTNIEVVSERGKKPKINLIDLNLGEIESMDLSLSHIADYAVASFVIAFKSLH